MAVSGLRRNKYFLRGNGAGPLPYARNHFVITTGFVATKVAERKVTEAKSDEEMQRWNKLTSFAT